MSSREAVEAPRIVVEDLWKAFPSDAGPLVALQAINLEVADHEFVCVLGPSGCGKTTLLRILAGLERQTSGRFTVRRTSGDRPARSVVFQEQSIFPWMRVRDNVGYGLAMRGADCRLRRELVDQYLEKVGLSRFADAFPYQLSGGMKQRVSLARAFANDPEVLLMDEPFAALDEQTKVILQEELTRIWLETRKTVAYITHSVDEALFLADRVVVMSSRPGRIKAMLQVPFERPRTPYGIRSDPRYGQSVETIWGWLRDEVQEARRLEARAL